MKHLGSVVLTVCVLCATVRAAAPVGAIAGVDRPRVIVGSKVIWQSQIDEEVASAKLREMPFEDGPIVDVLIDDALVLQRAAALQITVDEDEIDSAIGDIKSQNQLTDAQLDEHLTKQGWTRATYRLAIGRQITILRVINVEVRARLVISEDDISALAKQRGSADREALRAELAKSRMGVLRGEYVAALRKTTRIERRP